MQDKNWIPGPPKVSIDPDRLYVVLAPPDHGGIAVGGVMRGGDCNWQYKGIIAHYPLPFHMTKAEALRLLRTGQYEISEASADEYDVEREAEKYRDSCHRLQQRIQTIEQAMQQVQARARKWLQEPQPDNGEPEPEEITEAREIMTALVNVAATAQEPAEPTAEKELADLKTLVAEFLVMLQAGSVESAGKSMAKLQQAIAPKEVTDGR